MSASINTRDQGNVSTRPWATIAAMAYTLWGLWHLQVVYRMFASAGAIENAALQARIFQGAYHILFFCAFAVVVACYNWRNSRIAYWAQLFAIGWTEVGLFLFFMWPGLFPWLPTGWVGPALWVTAVGASTIAIRSR